jgi:uncharacterized protein YkwD
LRPEVKGLTLRLAFLGADRHVAVSAGERLSGTVNFLVGNDRARWHTNVPTYGQVVYRKLWPGIDLVFRGAKGRLKYQFVVQPGARVNDIRLAYRGASQLALDRAGNLLIRTSVGDLTDTRPVSYQLIGGKRVRVASRFVLGRHGLGFAVGAGYDPQRTLVIDPGLVYSTFLGGTGADIGEAIAVDTKGNAYVAGDTYSLMFPTTAGAFNTLLNGAEDAFITKLNRTGTALVYSTYLGGASDEPYWSASIAVDEKGSAYIAGTTYSPNFPTTPGAFDTTPDPINGDAFVTKLNKDGSGLVYSTFLGGSLQDAAYYGDAIALDKDGNAYVSGFTNSTDFPTRNAVQPTFGGVYDAFVTKFNKNGSDIVYSTYLGGSDNDDATGIAVSRNGTASVSGYTESTDFPVTPGAFQQTNAGAVDAFVTKLNETGNAFRFSTYLGGSGFDFGGAIDVDKKSNDVFVTGGTDSATDFPVTPGAFQTAYGGGGLGDAFVTKLEEDGSALEYSTYLGGMLTESGDAIAVDPTGHAHVTGPTDSTDFPTSPGAFQSTLGGVGGPFFYGDAFVTKLNKAGTGLDYSTYLGSTLDDLGLGIAVDWSGKVYVTGTTISPMFPTTPGAFDTTYNGAGPPFGYGDAFVSKFDVGARPEGSCDRNADSDKAEQDELAYINQQRSAALMRPLTLNTTSSNTARKHSCDERDHGDVAEHGSDGTTSADRLRASGMLFTLNAESLGVAVAPTESDALTALNSDLLTSASLTANALNPAFTQVGIGVVYLDGVMLLTADFTG